MVKKLAQLSLIFSKPEYNTKVRMDLSGMDLSEGVPSMDQVQQQQQAKAAYEEQKANILDQILEPGTKDRIKRLAIVNPDMATRIQDSLIQAATSGQLRNKVS